MSSTQPQATAPTSVADLQYRHEVSRITVPTVMPALKRELALIRKPGTKLRIFDVGCGHGAIDAALAEEGYEITGVDPSESGLELARKAHPHLSLHLGSAYDDLAARFGTFPAVISIEVVEHVFAPRVYARTVHNLLEPGGTFILSTPYHGWLKNTVIAALGGFDHHVNPLWDCGHIKFWSPKTISALLTETGFRVERIHRVGRIPPLARSMVVVARKA
ncbi:MAG: methyltransferase domain-containing protein [Phycisphaerales bacterium]